MSNGAECSYSGDSVNHHSPRMADLCDLYVAYKLPVHLGPAPFGRVATSCLPNSLRPQIVRLVGNVVTQLHLQTWAEQLAVTHRSR